MVLDPKDEHNKLIINGKKDKCIGIMTTYISREIYFHISRINYPNQLRKKLKNTFYKNNETQGNLIEKELISLNHVSLENIEDYLAHALGSFN